MSAKFCVDKHRDPDECSTSWNLRQSFLLAHHKRFPENRLVCLAQCFVNVELYGNKYPSGVMVQLEELARDLPGLVEARQERRTSKHKTMAFIKASSSDTGDLQSKKSGIEFPNSEKKGKMTFVKSTSDYQSTECSLSSYQALNQKTNLAVKRPHFELGEASNKSTKSKKKSKKKKEEIISCVGYGDETFAHLRHHLKRMMVREEVYLNPVMLLHQVLQKVPMIMDTNFKEVDKMMLFQCSVFLDGILITTGRDRSKKASKKMACEKTIKEVVKPYHMIVNVDGNKELRASDTPFEVEEEQEEKAEEMEEEDLEMLSNADLGYESNALSIGLVNADRNNRTQRHKDLEEMILLVYSANAPKATQFLRQSADFSKMLLEFDYSGGAASVSCRVTLEGQPLVECTAGTKLQAKCEASENAIDLLKKMCWTIEIKQHADSDASSLSKEELLGDVEKTMTVIPESNVGNQLLRKMGWVGGGVGKHGTGRAEPVSLQQVVNREGLGLDSQKNITADVRGNIKMCVENYAKSENTDDLVLSPDFTKEERALFHQHCKRLGMKSRSFGKDEQRYLIISRKRSPGQLFAHIMSKGGSTSKYQLIPPHSS